MSNRSTHASKLAARRAALVLSHIEVIHPIVDYSLLSIASTKEIHCEAHKLLLLKQGWSIGLIHATAIVSKKMTKKLSSYPAMT